MTDDTDDGQMEPWLQRMSDDARKRCAEVRRRRRANTKRREQTRSDGRRK